MRKCLERTMALLLTVFLLLAGMPARAAGTQAYSDVVFPGGLLKSIVRPPVETITYIFMNGTEEIGRQIVRAGDTLLEPEVSLQANQRFVGWEPQVSFGLVGEITETREITAHAQVETVYCVYFLDTNGHVAATRECADGETIRDFRDVTFPVAADESIVGWKDESGAVVSAVTIDGASVTLTAVVEKGYWITCESSGGSYIAPSFFEQGETAVPPSPPVKPGYDFAGWYVDAALTTPASFGEMHSNTTVYARWTPKSTQYTVIHWWENANDDGYSYHESETKYGSAGQLTAAAGKTNYLGFTQERIEQQLIKGDGSTIVNVYYKRIEYEVRFYEEIESWFSSTWSEITDHRITAKHGASIKDLWPGGVWHVAKTGSTAQAGLEVMPLGGKSFYGQLKNCTVEADYWVEALPGESGILHGGRAYKKDHTDRWPSNYWVTQEDLYEIRGFTFHEGTAIGASLKDADFYYTRSSWHVIYINNGSEAHRDAYLYEADISGAGSAYTPTTPPPGKENYLFDGWCADPEGSVPYAFAGKTMPAENITVYAKWTAPTHTVTVCDADRVAVLHTFERVPHGGTISINAMPTNVTIPPDGEFLGWVNLQDNKPFSFDTRINQDYCLYARVADNAVYAVAYDGSGASGTVPMDDNRYVGGAFAQLKSPGTLEKAGLAFLGWTLTAGEQTADYQPNDAMRIDSGHADASGVITLYAVWGRKPGTTTLTYDANHADVSPETVSHSMNGSVELPNNATVALYGEADTFSRPGFELMGWAKDAAAELPEYECGERVMVDDFGEGENRLYAVWKRCSVQIIVSKTVIGVEKDSAAFAFQASYTMPGQANAVMLAPFELQSGDSYTLEHVPIGATLTLVESGAANYTATVVCGEGSIEAEEGENGTRTFNVTVTEDVTAIAVTNAIKIGRIKVHKLVTGSMGDQSKRFEFAWRSASEPEQVFFLAHGQEQELPPLPYGTQVTIRESAYSGYTTRYQLGEEAAVQAHEVTFIVGKAEQTLTFTNSREAIPDTGILLDSVPYILLLACVMGAAALLLIIRRRFFEDD